MADLVNAPEGMGGAISAALYLSEFVNIPIVSAGSSAGSNAGAESGVNTGSTLSPENSVSASTSTSTNTNTIDVTKVDSNSTSFSSSSSSISSSSTEGKNRSSCPPLWVHVDFMGSKAGMAEPQGMRAVFEFIKDRAWETSTKN